MTKAFLKGCFLVAGLLAAQAPIGTSQELEVISYRNDPRLPALKSFFDALNSPATSMAEDFLAAADNHGLDWRLLPSIAILESGGGREFERNNIFGWDSCRTGFPSVRHGIYYVASRLANSNLYKDKRLDEILAVYNPHADYSGRVRWLMSRLDARLAAHSTLD